MGPSSSAKTGSIWVRSARCRLGGRIALTSPTLRIARDYAIDQTRKQQVRARYDVGLCENPDAFVWEGEDERDPIDQRRLLGVLDAQIAGGEMLEHAMEILIAQAEGVAHKVVAAELGITERALEGRLAAMRKRFRARVEELGLVERGRVG